MNDKTQFQFAIYYPEYDTIEVSISPGTVLAIRCKEFNAAVLLEDSVDIVYLYKLAREQPLTYVKLVFIQNGLKGYVDGMNCLIKIFPVYLLFLSKLGKIYHSSSKKSL